MPEFKNGPREMKRSDNEGVSYLYDTDPNATIYATGTCDICGEFTTDTDQAEVVEIATGKHLFAHAEGCHDAGEAMYGSVHPTTYKFA